ncbi:MAG: PQQ-dependent sugar dehydrogenase [Chloroflexi bacterium]|nr:PQQ-dependent sugar dehydrogenase [Chloroflexota bacterium]
MKTWAIRLAAVTALVVLATVVVLAVPRGDKFAQPEDFDLPNGHFFTQTGGGTGKGFAVTDGDGVLFWSEFRRLGGIQVVGYPISQRFAWDGFVSQAFQRVVFQWRPESRTVAFVNVFDQMSSAGFDDYLLSVRQVPKPLLVDDSGKPFQQVVSERLALLEQNQAIRASYFAAPGDPIQSYGLPTSGVVDMGNNFALRAQRVVLQQWKEDVPWARVGDTTVALGGDIAKEVGLLPDPAALQATDPPSGRFAPRVEVVATGLQVPWALAFAPDGRLFFTERPGRVRVIANGQLEAEPVAQLPVASVGESGLMGLALDPAFQQNGYLYIMYTYRDQAGNLKNRVSRLVESGGRAGNEVVLLDGMPGANIHDGGRIKFGPDRKLYVTLGDASNSSLAQQLGSPAGKIMRINGDGSIPDDNPFPGSPVWSLGHRNPQGLAWHPATGLLFSTEHGPVGNDEVNVVRAGNNYGWPTVTGTGGAPRFVDPILLFTPSVAPSGATFYDGSQLAPWRGSLFFTTLRGGHLHRVTLRGPDLTEVELQERLFESQFGRLRDVIQGPDGFLYFATNNRDGRGSPAPTDDRILRILP